MGGYLNYGTIFNFDTNGTNFKVVHDFDCKNGRFPEGNLMESSGMRWGLTRFGGKFNKGVVFSLEKDGTNFRNHFDFNITSRGAPYSSLIEVN